MGRVMFDGAWQTMAEVEALLASIKDRSYKRDKDGKFASGGGPDPGADSGVEALPQMDKLPTAQQAAQGTNPNYGTTVDNPVYRDAARAGENWTPDMGPPPNGAYEENCTNSAHTFEMRMRGYDVQAAPLDVLDRHGYAAGRTYGEIDDQLASSWSLPGGRPHGRGLSSQPWKSFKEVDAEVADWPDGGRGVIFTGKHVFNVVNVRGKAQYVESQFDASPTRVVTADYKKKFKAGLVFSGESPQEAKVVRLDDLEPASGILDAVVVP